MENQTETHAQTHEEWSLEEIKRRRQSAYSDPLTGSDILFIESMRMKEMGMPGWEDVKQKGIDRYYEIQQQHPYPAS